MRTLALVLLLAFASGCVTRNVIQVIPKHCPRPHKDR